MILLWIWDHELKFGCYHGLPMTHTLNLCCPSPRHHQPSNIKESTSGATACRVWKPYLIFKGTIGSIERTMILVYARNINNNVCLKLIFILIDGRGRIVLFGGDWWRANFDVDRYWFLTVGGGVLTVGGGVLTVGGGVLTVGGGVLAVGGRRWQVMAIW